MLRLQRSVKISTILTRQLPWAVRVVNDGKGPFEKKLFEASEFTAIYVQLLFIVDNKCGGMVILTALVVYGGVVFGAANLLNAYLV